VFFGWEETFDGDDYLIYGLDKEWLLEHPEAKSWSRQAQYKAVKAAGGCVIQAHPFRQHHYIRMVSLAPELIDGVEAANAGNQERYYDALAARYAAKLGLPVTAGSDIHHIDQARTGELYGVYLDRKLEGASDFASLIRRGLPRGPESLKIEEGRCESLGDESIDIPLGILDRNERVVWTDFWDFIERG
jgi:hypothetical protein